MKPLYALAALLVLTSCTTQPAKSIVKVTNTEGNSGGTGFVTLSKGKKVIVTNDHVCEVGSGGMVRVDDDSGHPYFKAILKRSDTRDLCVIEGIDAPALNLAEKAPERFDRIQIIGHPLLKPTAPSNGVFTGDLLMTFLSRPQEDGTCKGADKLVQIETFFGVLPACVKTEELSTTTAPCAHGNSGSPVLNTKGAVVGVVNSMEEDMAANFIPLTYLKDILDASPN